MHTIYVGKIAKRKNSTLQPTLTTSFDVCLKSPTSLHTPTFSINAASFDYNYIKWGDRYYFVTDIVSRNNSLWEVSAILDVLATFKADIEASTQYICYSNVAGDPWLADTRIPVLKSTHDDQRAGSLPFINTTGFYVLSVVGGDIVSGSGVGGCEIFAVNKSTLNQLIQSISTWSSDDITDIMQGVTIVPPSYNSPSVVTPASGASNGDCFAALINSLKNMIDSMGDVAKSVQDSANDIMKKIQEASSKTGFLGNAFANAPNCIRSCIWVPFDLASFTGSAGVIYLGKYDTGEAGFKVNPEPHTGSTSVSIPWRYSDWRRGVCEDVYLYLPFVGMVAYSADSLTNVAALTINYSVTATDGNICYEVVAGDQVLGTYGGNASTNYPIGINQQSSAGEVFTATVAGVQKTISAAVESTISPLSAGGAIAKMAVDIGFAAYNVKDVQNTTHFSCIGGIGGGAGCGLDLTPICYTVSHDTIVNPSDMAATMGVPTMKPMKIQNLSGYIQCANAHVAAMGAESSELDQIDAFLNSGFYYE